jgi:hypothetical protein
VSGVDFAALGTGMDIRQALDVLVTDGTSEEQTMAADTIRARLEALETRLNTARRTAWVAVPVEAETIAPGDVIVAKDGTLLPVAESGMDGDRWRIDILGQHVPGSIGDGIRMAPDRQVPVLRRPTADALDILTRQLGAQVTK